MLFTIAFLSVTGCEKKDEKVIFKGGTNPVLTSSVSDNITLSKANSSQNALTLNWTNPNYSFNTGLNSQNVTYTLQLAPANTGFASPSEISISNDLNKTFSVQELNSILMGRDFDGGKPYDMEFRLKTTLDRTVPLFSNVIKMTIIPYLDTKYPVPEKLFIIGDATPGGWPQPVPANQEFTKVNASTFELTIALQANKWIVFIPVSDSWAHKYAYDGTKGTNNPLGDDFAVDKGEDIASPTETGTYKITVDFKLGKYTLTKQ